MFDYLIVGAGFAGSVVAAQMARNCGKKVLLIDRREHVGGNAYDHYDDHGILVHKYGPHIFHTNSRDVYDYLRNSPNGVLTSTACVPAWTESWSPYRSIWTRSTIFTI